VIFSLLKYVYLLYSASFLICAREQVLIFRRQHGENLRSRPVLGQSLQLEDHRPQPRLTRHESLLLLPPSINQPAAPSATYWRSDVGDFSTEHGQHPSAGRRRMRFLWAGSASARWSRRQAASWPGRLAEGTGKAGTRRVTSLSLAWTYAFGWQLSHRDAPAQMRAGWCVAEAAPLLEHADVCYQKRTHNSHFIWCSDKETMK